MTRRSYQRLTVTIGIDSIADADASVGASCGGGAGEQAAQRKPGNRRDDAPRFDALAPDLHRAHAPVLHDDPRRAR